MLSGQASSCARIMRQLIRLVWESQEVQMPRVAFRLRIKAGKEAEYDVAHRNVWPALLSKLKEVGISEYSIFRREQDLFLVMQVDDFEGAWRALDNDPTNLKWQQ